MAVRRPGRRRRRTPDRPDRPEPGDGGPSTGSRRPARRWTSGPRRVRSARTGRSATCPTAALVVRRRALEAVGGFTPGLRVGEDVDLVWRLVGAGWRVRYAPDVTVGHAEPGPGRPAGPPLPLRHLGRAAGRPPSGPTGPGRVASVAGGRAPLAALAGRPGTAAGAVAGSGDPSWPGPSGPSGSRPGRRGRGAPEAPAGPWSGLGRAATTLASPVLVSLAGRGGRAARAALALAVVPPAVEWVRRRPDLDLPAWMAASVADDVAYGAGVWTGASAPGPSGPSCPPSGRAADNRDLAPPQK